MLDFPRLNRRQLDKLSDIFSDAALIALASVVLPAVFDKPDPLKVILGLVITFLCWFISLFLRR